MVKKIFQLDLGTLTGGKPPGITPAFGQFVAEAASVLLEYNRHKSGVSMEVAASKTLRYTVKWPTLHADANRTHNDLPAAAEVGAVGVAILLVEEMTQLKIIERSAKGSGIDYWLGTGEEPLFQNKARLEVSGIVADENAIEPRVKLKMKQSDRSAGKLPAYVAVVEFGKPKGVFKRR